jgi:hypothetical protein
LPFNAVDFVLLLLEVDFVDVFLLEEVVFFLLDDAEDDVPFIDGDFGPKISATGA